MTEPRPILGFGLIGWIASAVLLAIVAAALAGFDFQYHFIGLLCDAFGSSAMMWYMSRVHIPHSLYILAPMMSVITAGAAVVALYIRPGRGWWWRSAIVVAWGIMQPGLFSYERELARSVLDWILPWRVDGYLSWILHWTSMNMLTCLLLWIVTGSRRVLLVSVAASLAVALYMLVLYRPITPMTVFFPNPGPLDAVIGPLWQVAVAAGVLWWAIDARLHAYLPGYCANCGYDSARGLPRTMPRVRLARGSSHDARRTIKRVHLRRGWCMPI